MKASHALLSGLSGALALTAAHETLRYNVDKAPRMDSLGKQALDKILKAMHVQPPRKPSARHELTMGGDLAANAIYYSLIPAASPSKTWKRSLALGLLAGVGGLLLPRPMGLNPKFSNRTSQTQALTVALYLGGALTTALTYQSLSGRKG